MRFLLLLLLTALPTFAEDWPGWRGLRQDGTTDNAGYPTEWNATKNIKWKVPVPGVGHSSPVISKGKIFLTTCMEAEPTPAKNRALLCFDRATGESLWQRNLVASPLEKKHKLNSYASGTPAVDGERIYTAVYDQPTMRIYCHDYAGKKLWEAAPGEFHSVHGFSCSPTLFKNLVILNADQDPLKGGKAYIVALDKVTGEEKWRIDRPNKLRSYCPPVIIDVAGKPQMIVAGSKCVASYDPTNGQQVWLVTGPTEQYVASVVYHEGLIFFTAGFPERWVMAIDPTGTGNVTKTHVKWSLKKDGGYVPSPVAFAGIGYVVNDEGLASAWDIKTGKQLWRERLGGHQTGSGIVANGKIFFTDDTGMTFVIQPSAEKLDVIQKNPLGERVFSSPGFTDGQIFLRGEKHLFCIANMM